VRFDAESSRIEAMYHSPPNVQDDDDSDPQAHAHMAYPERMRREEHERRVISRPRSARRNRAHVENLLCVRGEPDSLRPQSEPDGAAARLAHARLPSERAREPCPRDVDEQRPRSRIPDGDRCAGRALQDQAERARAESDAAAGRGTRNGCRGRSEDNRCERASHRPIAVNVSVAV
jgi:hypothetical protein